MTRVNLVPVEELTSRHAMAELRELKMVPAALRRSLRTRKWNVVKSEIPKHYTLNTGHVKFFFDKLWYLRTRYFQLVGELLKRGYKLDPDNMIKNM